MGVIIDLVKVVGVKTLFTKKIVFTDEDMFIV